MIFAFAMVGLSTGITAGLLPAAQTVITAPMFIGRFGTAVAKRLLDQGTDVPGIESDPAIVQSLSSKLPHVVRADSTHLSALRQLGVKDIWAKANDTRHGRLPSGSARTIWSVRKRRWESMAHHEGGDADGESVFRRNHENALAHTHDHCEQHMQDIVMRCRLHVSAVLRRLLPISYPGNFG